MHLKRKAMKTPKDLLARKKPAKKADNKNPPLPTEADFLKESLAMAHAGEADQILWR